MANSENARIFFMGGNGIASTVKNVNTEIDDKRSYRVLSKSEGLFILI